MEKTEKKSFWNRINPFRKNDKSKKKVYSNTQNTVQKIKKTLLRLLAEKELSKISITDLVKVAGMYRATFYLHYRNIDGVVKDIENDVYACYENLKEQMCDVDIYNNVGMLFDMISENLIVDRQDFQIIINANAFSRLIISLKDLLQQALIENFDSYGHIGKSNNNYILNISMFTGAMIFAFKDWVNDDSLDLEELKRLARHMGKELFRQIPRN